MFVYMTRKDRCDLWRLLGTNTSPPSRSRATLRALLEEVSHTLWLATGQLAGCDKQDDCSVCRAWDEAAGLNDSIGDLLDEWDERQWQYRLRCAYRRVSPRRRLRAARSRREFRTEVRREAYDRVQAIRVREPLSCDMAQRAVEAATVLVSAGEADKVKAALAMVGADRVSEMAEGDVPAFLAALAP